MFRQIFTITISLYFLSGSVLATSGQEDFYPYTHINPGAGDKVLRKTNKVGLPRVLAQVELGLTPREAFFYKQAKFKDGFLNSCEENSKSLSLDIDNSIQMGLPASQSDELLFRDEQLMHELLFELFQKDLIQVEARLSSPDDWKVHGILIPGILIYIYRTIQENIDDLSDECRVNYNSNWSDLIRLSKKNLLIGRDMDVLKDLDLDLELGVEVPCLPTLEVSDWPRLEEGDWASHVRILAQELLIDRTSREEHVEQILIFLRKMIDRGCISDEKEDIERAISRLANVYVLSDLIRKGEGSFTLIYEKALEVVNKDLLRNEHVCQSPGHFLEVVHDFFGPQSEFRNLHLLFWFSSSSSSRRQFNSPLAEGLYANMDRIFKRAFTHSWVTRS